MKIELTLEEIILIKQSLFLSINRLESLDEPSTSLLSELNELFNKLESIQEDEK